MSEQDEFLKDLEVNAEKGADVFEQPLVEGKTVEPEPEKDEVKPEGNREFRRMKAKWEAEREASIALAAKLEVLTEAQKLQRDTEPSEYLQQVERIYGTESPEAKEATNLLAKAMENVEKRATERALELFRQEQQQQLAAERKASQELDSMIDDLEDTHNVVLDASTRQSFFQMLQKVSPKDEHGDIREYADHHAVFEMLQSQRKPESTRAKDLASRSMVKTGAAAPTKDAEDANMRWLKENGII